MSYDAYLFDLDGTLLDTAVDLVTAFRDSVDVNTSCISNEELSKVVGQGSKQAYDFMIERGIQIPDYEQCKTRFIDNYKRQGHTHTRLFTGITDIINKINASSKPWGIVTNKYFAGAKDVLRHFPELQNYHTLVGADTANRAKPDAAPLLYACEEINIKPNNCLYIGDTITDIAAAMNAKMEFALAHYSGGYTDIAGLDCPIKYILHKVSDLLDII